jgi:transcriptional regulator with XRE-family HTH domain
MNYKELGKNIKKTRESKCLQQKYLAKIIGIRSTVMNKIESGNRVRAIVFLKTAIALNVTLTSLLNAGDAEYFEWQETDMKKLLKKFSKNLRSKRLDMKLSANCMTKECGLSKESIRRLEKLDRMNADIFKYKKIADFLGVTLEDLFLKDFL